MIKRNGDVQGPSCIPNFEQISNLILLHVTVENLHTELGYIQGGERATKPLHRI